MHKKQQLKSGSWGKFTSIFKSIVNFFAFTKKAFIRSIQEFWITVKPLHRMFRGDRMTYGNFIRNRENDSPINSGNYASRKKSSYKMSVVHWKPEVTRDGNETWKESWDWNISLGLMCWGWSLGKVSKQGSATSQCGKKWQHGMKGTVRGQGGRIKVLTR